MYRRGIVTELDPATGRARVEFEDRDGVVSWWLNVNQPAASTSKVYAMPDVGAQVNCLVDANAEEGCILGALYSDVDRPPISDPRHERRELEGGLMIDYDRDNGRYIISTPGGIIIRATVVIAGPTGQMQVSYYDPVTGRMRTDSPGGDDTRTGFAYYSRP